ncbi:hypothetical protein NC651_021507 [Populus alba x Populus x berolinensis]|nr:hypothetical protein NC651_021507 [Populus alba x Populus x berolinensis]
MLIFDDIFTRGDVASELSISESSPSSNSSSRSSRSYPESLHKPIIFHRAHCMSNNKPNYQPTPYPNTYPRVDHLQDLKVVMGMAKSLDFHFFPHKPGFPRMNRSEMCQTASVVVWVC